MFGRSKYCSVCGVKIENMEDYPHFGKHFCSEEHANRYAQEVQKSNEVYSLLETRSECLVALAHYYLNYGRSPPSTQERLKQKIIHERFLLKETNRRLLELEEATLVRTNLLKES